MKTKARNSKKGPVEVVKEGSIQVPMYETGNRIYRLNPTTGQRELTADHPQFTLAFYEEKRRVRRKFTDLESARAEAQLAVVKLANVAQCCRRCLSAAESQCGTGEAILASVTHQHLQVGLVG